MIFAICWNKLRSYTFWKPHIDIWKQAKNRIHRGTHYEETALSKIENFLLFGVFYFKNKNSWHFQFPISQIFWQRFIVFEILTNKSKLLLKLRAVEPSTLFKKRPWHRCFPVNIAKFLTTPFLKNTSDGCFS